MQIKKKYKGRHYQLIFFLALMLLVFGILFNLERIMIPLGIAYVLSLMLEPLNRALYSVSLRKKTFSIIVAMALAFVFFYPFVKGIKTISEESHKIEYYLPKFESYLREKYSVVKSEIETRFNYEIKVNPIDNLMEFGQSSTKTIVVYLPYILTSLLEWGFIIPLFLFFLLKDGRRIRFNFLKIVPNSIVERTYFLFHQFNTKFGDYIFAKFIEATLVGVIITSGLAIMNFPFAFLLGVVAAITNILPYIGPILGFLPALIIGLVDQNPNTMLGAMIILYIVANIIDLALVFPLLVSKIVNLHPIVVVVSVILGSQFAGVIGMIISIPMAAFLKLLFNEFYRELYSDNSLS
jgi:putative permease